MRIALLTSNDHKAQEVAAALGNHGQRVTVIPIEDEDATLDAAQRLLDDGYDFVLREQTALFNSATGRQIEGEPDDMAAVSNKSCLIALRQGEGRRISEKVYISSIDGFIDLDRRKDDGEVYGWDDIFVPIEGGHDMHSMKLEGIKTSARQIVMGRFLADNVHFTDRPDMRFFPMKQDRTFEFNSKAFDFVTGNDLIRKGTAGHWLDNVLRNVLMSGIFFRSAASRREKNYWLPGLNAGIPLTAKKDEIHEITFLFHDLMHFQLPDLIPDVDGDLARQVYVGHRVMGEALTLVLADMVFVDNLAGAGVEYDYSKRLIHPLYRHMKVSRSLDGLMPLVRAMSHYAVFGDDSLLKELLEPGDEAADALEAFKVKYGRFFSEDLRWTERNYEQFTTHARYIGRWLDIVSKETLAECGLSTLSRFMLSLNCGRNPTREEVLDDILQTVFSQIVFPNAKQTTDVSAETCISNAFRRYMIGQMSIFARYGNVLDMPAVRKKLSSKIASPEILTSADIEGMRSLFETYVDGLERRQLIDPSDALTYRSVHPLFPPFYVFYDAKGSGGASA